MNEITGEVVDAAVAIHRKMGPGLLEHVYEVLLCHELEGRGLEVARQVALPLEMDGLHIPVAFRADVIVEGRVLLELKSVERLHRVHKKQTLTYLRVGGFEVGLLLNFGGPVMREGIVRLVDRYKGPRPSDPESPGRSDPQTLRVSAPPRPPREQPSPKPPTE